MNDPFFSAVDEAQPVFASKTLRSDEAPNLDNFSYRNNSNIGDIQNSNFYTREVSNKNHNRQNTPSRNAPHRRNEKRNDIIDTHHKVQGPQPRLPSMLNDIKAPKPLKINPNKPPQSKKYFNIQTPDRFTHAKPYEGV